MKVLRGFSWREYVYSVKRMCRGTCRLPFEYYTVSIIRRKAIYYGIVWIQIVLNLSKSLSDIINETKIITNFVLINRKRQIYEHRKKWQKMQTMWYEFSWKWVPFHPRMPKVQNYKKTNTLKDTIVNGQP